MVFLRDRFVPLEEATIALSDAGYLLGDGVFATMRAYEGACFRPELHVAILARGCERLGIPLPASTDELVARADETARRVARPNAYVRITVTRGSGTARGGETAYGSAPTLSVLGRALVPPSEDDYAQGVHAAIVTPRRIPPACADGTVKTTSYAPSIVARREAHERGCAEGIQLAIDGSVACGTMANLFVVAGNALVTPPLATGCRDGIVRQAVLSLAARAGLEAHERTVSPSDLHHADEVFFTNSRIECLPVATIDGRRVGTAVGASKDAARGPDDASGAPSFPHTQRLRHALHELALAETAARRAAWRSETP